MLPESIIQKDSGGGCFVMTEIKGKGTSTDVDHDKGNVICHPISVIGLTKNQQCLFPRIP